MVFTYVLYRTVLETCSFHDFNKYNMVLIFIGFHKLGSVDTCLVHAQLLVNGLSEKITSE